MSFSIFADESGTDPDHKCYTIGAIVIPTLQLDRFNAEFEKLKKRHGVQNEIKWKKINKSHGAINFAIDLFLFIIHNNLRIGFIVVKKDAFRKWKLNKESAFYTTYCMLFQYVLKMEMDEHHIYIDSRQDSYGKNDEVVEKISNNMLASINSTATVKNVVKSNSKELLAIQAIDLFTGAINASHNLYLNKDAVINKGKTIFIEKIARCLGWDTLHYDTYPSNNINIWHFPEEYRSKPISMSINVNKSGNYVAAESVGL